MIVFLASGFLVYMIIGFFVYIKVDIENDFKHIESKLYNVYVVSIVLSTVFGLICSILVVIINIDIAISRNKLAETFTELNIEREVIKLIPENKQKEIIDKIYDFNIRTLKYNKKLAEYKETYSNNFLYLENPFIPMENIETITNNF